MQFRGNYDISPSVVCQNLSGVDIGQKLAVVNQPKSLKEKCYFVGIFLTGCTASCNFCQAVMTISSK